MGSMLKFDHSLEFPVLLLVKRTNKTTCDALPGASTCAVNFTFDGEHALLRYSMSDDIKTETNPSIWTVAVAVCGVNNVGVSTTTVGDGSRVFVAVFSPTSVGVYVNVTVGEIGVPLGIGVYVLVGLGIGVAEGRGASIRSLMEQDTETSAHTRRVVIFFMAF